MRKVFVRSIASGFLSLRRTVTVLALILGVLLLAVPMFSQTANGRISGTVKDQTGGAIVGATVVVTDVARGLARNLTTDEAGAYLAPNLIPGGYTVRATFTGFQAWERTNLTLGVGGDLAVDVVLLPGAQTQTVTITEELPMINTTSAVLGGTLSSETILDLPLGSRNFKNLLDLRPGTVTNLGNDSGGGGAQVVNGLRPESSNEFMMEGLHGLDPYTGQSMIGNLALRGDGASILPADAIQEFSQQFNNKAEYGLKAGASVNVGLKSGTNALHGTAYSFFRDVGTDARDFFNKTATQPKVNGAMQQFGATVGGPIKRDKVFFFLGYEQQNYTQGSPSPANVAFTDPAMISNFPACLTAGAGGTNACAPLANSIAGTRTPDASNHLILACLGVPLAARSAQSLSMVSLSTGCVPGSNYPNSTVGTTWLVPHGGNDHGISSGDPNPNTYYPNTQIKNRSIGAVAKVDYTLNDKNVINAFMFTGNGNNEGETTRTDPIWGNRAYQTPTMIAGTWTWLPSSSWANSFRVGKAKIYAYYRGVDMLTGLNPATLGLPTGVTQYTVKGGYVENAGYPQSLGISGLNGTGSRNSETRGPGESLEISDQINYLRGNHSIRLGGMIMNQAQNGGTWANTRGTFSFGRGSDSSGLGNGLLSFIAGQNAIPDNIPGPLGFCPSPGIVSGTTCSVPAIRAQPTGLESASLFYGNPESNIRRSAYSIFVQDDWRIRPRLTLNLGLRYDLISVPHDQNYILGSFDPNLGLVQEGNQIPEVHRPDHNNFGPRAGFAWDMFGTGKTVLRVGGSMVFELTPLGIYVETGNAAGSAGNPTAWVIGCTVTPNSLDTDVASGIQTVPTNAASNCGAASGGTYVSCTGNGAPVPQCTASGQSVLTSATGFNFTGASLFTSGGTRSVGQVNWSRGDSNILNVVLWDNPAGGTRDAIYPTSTILNCNPAIRTRDGAIGTVTNGRAGSRCNITAMDRRLSVPYIETWTLSIQHAIVNNVVLDIAYVGNHGTKLIGRLEDNQPYPLNMWKQPSNANPAVTYEQACAIAMTADACDGSAFSAIVGVNGTAKPFNAKFAHIGNIIRVTNPHTSNYNGLQMTLSARNFHGLSLTSGFTYAKANDVAGTSGSGAGTDTYNVGYDYGRGGSDIRKRFTLSGVYQLPGVMGYGGFLQGWKLNGIFRFQTGRAWSPGANGDFIGTGRNSRWDFAGDKGDFVVDYHGVDMAVFHPGNTTPPPGINPRTGSAYVVGDLAINTAQCTSAAASAATLQAFGCWTHGTGTITPPAVNSYGSMQRGLFSGPRYVALDLSVTKRHQVTERFAAEFRAESFNILNHPALGQPASGLTNCNTTACTFGTVSNTPAVAATNSYLGSGGPRRFQFGVKIIF